jgi:hypothetical protein
LPIGLSCLVVGFQIAFDCMPTSSIGIHEIGKDAAVCRELPEVLMMTIKAKTPLF